MSDVLLVEREGRVAVLTINRPDKLNALELELMKEHASLTRDILAQVQFVPAYAQVAEVAAAHHERLDGTGYPDGLRGEQLPLQARILCVADIYHALTQDRSFRPGISRDEALAIVQSLAPHQLDEHCVAALMKFLGVPREPQSRAQAA